MPSSLGEVRIHSGAPYGVPALELKVHRSGYYAWLREPLSPRAKVNEVLTLKIREFYDQSIGIYGSPRILCDLREAGLACGENRVARLMKSAQIKKRIYNTREEARSEVFDYIEGFYNRVRRHKHLD